jgi:hypothetical protein
MVKYGVLFEVRIEFWLYGFWALWDNVTVAMVMLSNEAINVCILFCVNNAQKLETVYSSMVCYVQVRLYNAVKQMFACWHLAAFVIKQR